MEIFPSHIWDGVWTLKKAKLIRAETPQSVNPHCAHWDKIEKLCISGPVSVGQGDNSQGPL